MAHDEPLKTICIVGFRLDRKHSIGYNSYENSDEVADEVKRLLDDKGAEVISIRVVKTVPNVGVPSTNHNHGFKPDEEPVRKEATVDQLMEAKVLAKKRDDGEQITNDYLEKHTASCLDELSEKEILKLIEILEKKA